MKFKNPFNSEEKKRRRIAKQALEEMRRLAAAKYPIAMHFDKVVFPGVERRAGDSWPDAFARYFGMELTQLRDFVEGIIATGLYLSTANPTPTAKDLLSYFRGFSALLIEVERELASINLKRGNSKWPHSSTS